MRDPITVAYIRVSKGEAMQPNSVAMQRTALDKLYEGLKDKIPEYIPGEYDYPDLNVSGRYVDFCDRPQAKRMFEELQKGDHLLVWRVDRIGRTFYDIIATIDRFMKLGVTIHVADMLGDGVSEDLSSPSGVMKVAMLSMAAQLEHMLISARTKEGLAAVKAKGVRMGPPPPGHKYVGKGIKQRMVVHEEEQQWMEMIYRLHMDHGYNFRDLTRLLNVMGAKTNRGKPWPYHRVKTVIHRMRKERGTQPPPNSGKTHTGSKMGRPRGIRKESRSLSDDEHDVSADEV